MNSNAEINAIAELDLDPIKVKLMHKESGEGWSRVEVDAVEFEYRRFLCLMKMFPNEQVAPRFDVDIFWHYHILDTMKYAADCEQVFGYFLHHFPYAGLRGEADETAHQRVGARMQELYEATFGDSYHRRDADVAASAMTAFSIPVAAANDAIAFSIPVSASQMKTAFSIPVSAASAKTAFSIPVSAAQMKTAFSIPVSSANSKTAFSIPVSSPNAKTAFSIPVSAVLTKTAFSIPSSMPVAQNDPFYTERPTLAMAA